MKMQKELLKRQKWLLRKIENKERKKKEIWMHTKNFNLGIMIKTDQKTLEVMTIQLFFSGCWNLCYKDSMYAVWLSAMSSGTKKNLHMTVESHFLSTVTSTYS